MSRRTAATLICPSCSKWDRSETHHCGLAADHEGACVLTSIAPLTEPILTDEALLAQRDALAAALRDVLRLCVDRKAHAFADAQEALNIADALLVEMEGAGG